MNTGAETITPREEPKGLTYIGKVIRQAMESR
jgi:hypothetical protein